MKKETELEDEKGRAPRVAASSYLNTAPLVWSFLRGSRRADVDLIMDAAPARCADMLARGEVEAALVPVIEYQRIPDLAVIPRVCVGSRSKVKSVVIVARGEVSDLRSVRTVSLDTSSRTSAALVKVIFREFLESEPEWRESVPDVTRMLEASDAALVIGDPGMTFSRRGVVVYDLAELWREQTGLGFVFAMWMARASELEKVGRVDFAGARDEGLRRVDEIADAYSSVVNLPPEEIKSYLLENISYEVSEELRGGLELFYRLAHKHKIIRDVRPLKMVGG